VAIVLNLQPHQTGQMLAIIGMITLSEVQNTGSALMHLKHEAHTPVMLLCSECSLSLKSKQIQVFLPVFCFPFVYDIVDVDVDVDGVYERRPKPLCPHLEITLR